MPPFILAALGVAGAMVATRFLVRESRRVTRILDAHRDAHRAPPSEDKGERLEKDPATGAYRPRRHS